MNYQEMDLKELQTLLAVKRTGINVSKEYYKLCKEFTHKKVLFKTLEELNGLFEKFLGFCSKEEDLRFDITPYGRGGSQKTKKELQGKYMHAMRSRTLEQMEVLRNSFNSAYLKFDTELLKWKLHLNVNFSEIREGKEEKTFYTNYFHLGFRMLISEEEVSADVFLSSLEESLTEASLDFSKKDLGILQKEIVSKTSYSFDNLVVNNAAQILNSEEELNVIEQIEDRTIKPKEVLYTEKEQENVVQQNIVENKLTGSDIAVLFHIYTLNYDEYNENEEEKKLLYSKFTKSFIDENSTKESVKEAIAMLFEIELFDLIE